MNNYHGTYQIISEILNPVEPVLDKLQLASIDWEKVVQLGSKHLVLPAIYYQLKHKELLEDIPEDLHFFLQDIAERNTRRNESIMQQALQIQQLFDRENIQFTFLKGAAMLFGNVYNFCGERMIGDIDVLVDVKQVDKAYHLLLKHGYAVLQDTPGHANLNPKHKPRLVSKDDRYIAAVEIHNRLFDDYTIEELIPSKILESSTLSNAVRIPKTEHLLFHTVLNWQINDGGMVKNWINFRSIYDCSVLLKKAPNLKDSKQLQRRAFQHYFSLYNLFYPAFEFKPHTLALIKRWFFVKRLKFPLVNLVLQKVIRFRIMSQFLLGRTYSFMKNKKYRKAILSDRNEQASKLKKFIRK